MAKIKKKFDKELMYKKIMPTNLKRTSDDSQILMNDINDIKTEAEMPAKSDNSVYENKEIFFGKENKEIILYNIMERLVLDKLEAALQKMNCCRCDRCKEDIIAIALNNLKPMYVVASRDDIDKKLKDSEKLGMEVTTAVLKAVLAVRKNPRH